MRDLYGKTRQQDRHTGHIAVILARLIGAPENNIFDTTRINIRTFDRFADDERAHVVGPHILQRAAVAPDKRTHREMITASSMIYLP